MKITINSDKISGINNKFNNKHFSKIEREIMEMDFKDKDFDEIDVYKKLIEDEFNELVCNKTISDFSLKFDNDVDENGILTVDAQIRLNAPVRYYTIKESDFPELTHEQFIEMCKEIKSEIEKNNGCGS